MDLPHPVSPSQVFQNIYSHAPLDPPAVLKNDSDVETITEDCQENNARTPQFRVAKCVAIASKTEAYASVPTSTLGLIYMAPHPNLVRKQMVLLASGIVNALPHIQTKKASKCFRKTDKNTERKVNRLRNRPTESNCLPEQSCKHPTKKRKEEDKSVPDTVSTVQYKEKNSRRDQVAKCKEIETVEDSKLDTEW